MTSAFAVTNVATAGPLGASGRSERGREAEAPRTRIPSRGADLRDQLRAATREVHERLHRHEGFKAAADGTITRFDYRALLGRLYGFHVAFERAALLDGWRGEGLRQDLSALGATAAEIGALPLCPELPDLRASERRAGALYVVEGSALGGRVIAQALRPMFGAAALRFFEAGGRPGAWRACLEEMDRLAGDLAASRRMIEAAQETFDAFDAWLDGWRIGHD